MRKVALWRVVMMEKLVLRVLGRVLFSLVKVLIQLVFFVILAVVVLLSESQLVGSLCAVLLAVDVLLVGHLPYWVGSVWGDASWRNTAVLYLCHVVFVVIFCGNA